MLSDETENSLQINNDFGLELVDKNGEAISDSSGGIDNGYGIISWFKKSYGIKGPLIIIR